MEDTPGAVSALKGWLSMSVLGPFMLRQVQRSEGRASWGGEDGGFLHRQMGVWGPVPWALCCQGEDSCRNRHMPVKKVGSQFTMGHTAPPAPNLRSVRH